MKKVPEYDLLAAFYPATQNAETVKILIGGDVNQDHYKNTCIMRVSRSLNYAGSFIPSDTKKFRTKRGTDDKWYGLRVDEFWTYMTETYGKPTIYERPKKGGRISREKFESYRGIIGFRAKFNDATGHFTLWNGYELLYGGEDHDYFRIAYEAVLWQAGDVRVIQAPV